MNINDVCHLSGFTRDGINKIFARLDYNLASGLEKMRGGKPRCFSRSNVLEICFICVLLQCGVSLKVAAATAHRLLIYEQAGCFLGEFTLKPHIIIKMQALVNSIDDYQHSVNRHG